MIFTEFLSITWIWPIFKFFSPSFEIILIIQIIITENLLYVD